MAKENPSISESKASSPSPTQTPTPTKPSSSIQTSKPLLPTHPKEDVEETPKTFDGTQTTQTQLEVEVKKI